jgi:hypothetical protein
MESTGLSLWWIIDRKETAGGRGGRRLDGRATLRTETAPFPPKPHFSCVDCPSFHREGRLPRGFGKRRVGVTDPGNIFRTAGKLEHGDRLSNQLGGTRSNDVNAQESVRCRAGDDPQWPEDARATEFTEKNTA